METYGKSDGSNRYGYALLTHGFNQGYAIIFFFWGDGAGISAIIPSPI
jgi:hypothetical protein